MLNIEEMENTYYRKLENIEKQKGERNHPLSHHPDITTVTLLIYILDIWSMTRFPPLYLLGVCHSINWSPYIQFCPIFTLY